MTNRLFETRHLATKWGGQIWEIVANVVYLSSLRQEYQGVCLPLKKRGF